jgi:hypothetical protein
VRIYAVDITKRKNAEENIKRLNRLYAFLFESNQAMARAFNRYKLFQDISLDDRLKKKEGIHDVKANNTTGSVTIRYEHQRHGAEGIYQILEDTDVIIADLTGAAQFGESASVTREYGTPFTFISAVEDLNKRLSKAAGAKIDLKTALPVSLIGLGVWSIARSGLGINKVTGILFLWLAFDAFVRLHPHPVHSSPSYKKP